ncbi:MAG: glutamate synthase subunit alpha, partial [Actinobacteria bacterium]|nr:glutamate synthase subunit alpha [Actinomycetota bacterium]
MRPHGLHSTTARVSPWYDPRFEHDACGTGFVANLDGRADHQIVQLALAALGRLAHRGAIAADAHTGDGAGLLTQLPRGLLREAFAAAGGGRVNPAHTAVAMVFLNQSDPRGAARFQHLAEGACDDRGIRVIGWRAVPLDRGALGMQGRASCPGIRQLLLARGPDIDGADAFERRLFLARKTLEARATQENLDGNYVVSMSCRSIVYKGLIVGTELASFYPDLRDARYTSAAAVFHQRYSTNTSPSWELAQPFRMLAHNGEINTLQGNRNWMAAREAELTSGAWGADLAALKPITDDRGSDSYSLDHALELLTLSGRSLPHALMTLVPEAWELMPDMPADLRGFYAYQACLTEPWDGPAALALSDGRWVCGALDRNGLRPARYSITDHGLICLASEAGVLELDDHHIVEKGRLGPGRMIAVDLERGRLLYNDAIKAEVCAHRPYREWVARRLTTLDPSVGAPNVGRSNGEAEGLSGGTLTQYQHAFGFSKEDLSHLLEPMALEGKDPVFSMGNDAPLAALSHFAPSTFGYVKQRFAQVTNPPIDPIREQLVMSLDVLLGPRGSLLEESDEAANLLHLPSPFLYDEDLAAIEVLADPRYRTARLDATFAVADGPAGLEPAIEALCQAARQAVDGGAHILIVSDRKIGPARAPVPLLLSVGALHHALIAAGCRMRTDIVAETGQAWDVHHFCALIGYGASAINPYATLQAIAHFEGANGSAPANYRENFKRTVEAGVLKVMSKMGISTLSSYHAGQIFEAVGLSAEIVDRCLRGTPPKVGGIGFAELAADVLRTHAAAFGAPPPEAPADIGWARYRQGGEFHATNPAMVKALQRAVNSGLRADFQAYERVVDGRAPYSLRDLLRFKASSPIPIEDVEPVEALVQRFTSTAMSIGALSPEAHRTLSKGMNRIGARSNTGEGGEDPAWYQPDAHGDWPDSRIKQ